LGVIFDEAIRVFDKTKPLRYYVSWFQNLTFWNCLMYLWFCIRRSARHFFEEVVFQGGRCMKTTKKWLFGLLALGFVFAGCEMITDGKTVDLDLHGTWESADKTLYSGTLVIDLYTITITGYNESQTPRNGDDNERPFKGFAKGAPLTCYTEDGKLFIERVGGEQSVLPYLYTKRGQDRYLTFRFGSSPIESREEALKRVNNY
jgi:hypothetical protein